MAKGWSFGALTAALKSSAFIDTTAVAGDAVGNVMSVGFVGIGRTGLGVVGSVNLTTYRWHLGECIYVNSNNISYDNAATAGKFRWSNSAVRISCIAVADSVWTLLMQDSTYFYIVTINGNSNPFGFDVKQVAVSNGANDMNIYQGTVNVGPSDYSTIFLKGTGGNQAYVQYDAKSGQMYIAGGGSNTGRITIAGDGTTTSDQRFIGRNGVSEFWGCSAGEFYTQGKPGSRIGMNQQGVHIGWNEDGAPSSGATAFVNNQGGGQGGFRFRNVNAPNTAQTAEWRMDGANGNFISSGNVMAVAKCYAGNGASFFAEDGNSYGGVWGGWLSNWLSARLGERDSNINNRFREVRAVNQRQVNNTNGPLGGFLTGLGDFGANDGYAWISDLQLYKDSAGWVQCGIG